MNKRHFFITVIFVVLFPFNLLASFSSVEKLFKKKPPLYKILEKIYRLTYRSDTFDCSNKAALFVRILSDANISSKIMIIRNEEKYGNVLHALVLISDYEGHNVVCDPTNDEWYFDNDIDNVGKFVCFIPQANIQRDEEEYGFAKTVYNKMKATLSKIICKK